MILLRPEFVFAYDRERSRYGFEWQFTPVEVSMSDENLAKWQEALAERLATIEQRLEVIDEAIDRLAKVVTRGYIPLDKNLNWKDE